MTDLPRSNAHLISQTHAPRHQSSLLTITDPATLTPQTPEPTETATGDEDSQHSYNLSSLIDFDPDTTTISQETVATEVTQAPRSRAREVHTHPPSQPILIPTNAKHQRAETLRLRLRLAHYKVLTNQINTPFSQLVIHPLSPHTQTPQQPIQEETPEPSLPRLLPAPVLQQSTHLPSSPPNSQGSTSPEKEIGTGEEREAFRTPALPRQRGAIRQTSSPPDSSEKYVRGSGRKDGELSSSVIKSKAAMSLMGLSVGQC